MANPLSAVTNFLREVKGEMTKVVWPTRNETIRHTIVVLVSIAVAMAILALVDYGLTAFVQKTLVEQ